MPCRWKTLPWPRWIFFLPGTAILLFGVPRIGRTADTDSTKPALPFAGAKAGDGRDICGVKLCWCPAGRFVMGSPRSEPERRPDEDQVTVTLTKGFWVGKFETTQGDWKQV